METNNSLIMALIEQLGVAALRVGFTVAVIVFSACRSLHLAQATPIFDRDSNVENGVHAVRHNREEEIIFVWSGLMLVLLAILYQVWSA
jgi:hypothetical protein